MSNFLLKTKEVKKTIFKKEKLSISEEPNQFFEQELIGRGKFNEDFKLFYASVYRFIKTCSEFLEKFKNNNFEIGIITTIPRQSGLGGSASIIIAILFGFAKYFGLYKNLTCINKEDFPIVYKLRLSLLLYFYEVDNKILHILSVF